MLFRNMRWLSFILVLLSNGTYINTDHIYSINNNRNRVYYGFEIGGSTDNEEVTKEDIETLKQAMGVYERKDKH